MRKIILILSLFSLTANAQRVPKVVYVIADGIPADVLERLQPPAIQQIIKQGSYHRAYVGGIKGSYKETPTISAPGYNNLLTGVWGYKHNVWDNDDQHPNYNYPSLFRLAKWQKKPVTTAIFSTWLDNRTVLVGEGLPQTGKVGIDYIFDGYEKDTARFPHDRGAKYIHQIDETVIQAADSVIRLKAPDLSWIYLEYTDDMGHRHGTGPIQDAAIGMLDSQMAKIAGAIKYREENFKEDWLLVITTDHGRDSVTGRNHGGQSTRERTTWIVLSKPVTNTYWEKGDPAIIDIYPSIANYLSLQIPSRVWSELDGTPFIGKVSVTNATQSRSDDNLTIGWTAFQPKEEVEIAISYTNLAKEGGEDVYQVLGKVAAGKEKFTIQVPGLANKTFYKILVKGKHNTLNTWHLEK